MNQLERGARLTKLNPYGQRVRGFHVTDEVFVRPPHRPEILETGIFTRPLCPGGVCITVLCITNRNVFWLFAFVAQRTPTCRG